VPKFLTKEERARIDAHWSNSDLDADVTAEWQALLDHADAADDLIAQIEAVSERRRSDRLKLLDIKTMDGLSASECLMRTADAEARAKKAEAELQEVAGERDTYRAVLEQVSPELHCLRRQTNSRPGGSVDRATEAVLRVLSRPLPEIDSGSGGK
jgi:predicted  nucleic acid-binding Zn-ribbon protein